jgi:hypothetical protein
LFAYFPTKDDLVLHRFADHEDEAARSSARANRMARSMRCMLTCALRWSAAIRSPGCATTPAWCGSTGSCSTRRR